MAPRGRNKKKQVMEALYAKCKASGCMAFNNKLVKEICEEIGFSNQFDITKVDSSAGLPDALVKDDVLVVHLGGGNHQFVYGISTGYHQFEPIPDSHKFQWDYRPSILNNINTSESNTLSVGYNQRIIHRFLYEDITAAPKIYSSNRTHIPLDYYIGEDWICATRVQVEIDMTMEHNGAITVFEAKNGNPADFNVFQLFNPYRYYLQATENSQEVSSIDCCYLLRYRNRLRLYLYRFEDPQLPASIRLVRSAEYELVER